MGPWKVRGRCRLISPYAEFALRWKEGLFSAPCCNIMTLIVRPKTEQTELRVRTTFAVIPPCEDTSFITTRFLRRSTVLPSGAPVSTSVISAYTCPWVDSRCRFFRVASVSPGRSGGRRNCGTNSEGSTIKVSFTELCSRVIET